MDPQQLRRDLQNVAFTTTVPFTDDADAIDHDALHENVAGLYDAGATVFVPCGNTGEYYSLTDEERIAVVETHAEATPQDATVVAGVGGNVEHVEWLASAYDDVGADAIMIMNPAHTYVHEEGLKTYYHQICDAIDLGVVVYKRGPELSSKVLSEVCKRESIVAVKFALEDLATFTRTVDAVDGSVTWINGIAERYALSFAVNGAAGYTTGLGNFLPRTTLMLFNSIQNGHWERARTIQRTLQPIEDLRDEPGDGSDIPNGNNVPVVKYGMELAGFEGGPVRPPLTDLCEADRKRLERRYQQIEGTLEEPT